MSQGGQTSQAIPIVGQFEQIKAGLGFGPKRKESASDIQVDQLAGLIDSIALPQGKQLNRISREWQNLIDSFDAGVRGIPFAEEIIALGAAQGFVITLDQLLQPASQPLAPFLPVGIPTPVTVDAAGNAILDPRFPARLAPPRVSAPTGARGLGFTTPSGFPILPPSGPSRGPSTTGGFNFARFIQCLLGSFSPSAAGGRQVPFVTTAGPQASAGGFDFGGFLSGAVDIARNIFSPPQAPAQRFPGLQTSAFPILPTARALLPSLGAGAVGGSLGQGLADFFFESGGASDLDEAAAFTDPVPGRCRPKPHVKTNPCTGKGVWFVPRGRPLVFSGDLSAARRLDRVAKTLDKARPKRRHHHHAKRRPR